MSYVIYNIETTRLHRVKGNGVGCFRDEWLTEGAAKAALTRGVNAGKLVREEWAIAHIADFRNSIEKTRKVKNLMSGKEVEISVNTPSCCDPSSERYWSM